MFKRMFYVLIAVFAFSLYFNTAASADQTMGMVTYKDGSATFFPGTRTISSVVLAKDLLVPGPSGITCTGGEIITFFKNGEWESCVIKNSFRYAPLKEKTIIFKAGTVLVRSMNGTPVSGTVGSGTSYEGVPIKADEPITFDSKGVISSFVLSGDWLYKTITWKGGTKMSFHSNGVPSEGVPASNFKFGNVTLQAGKRTSFSSGGNIERLNY